MLSVIVTQHRLVIPPDLPLILQTLRKELPRRSLNLLAHLQRQPVVYHLEEPPLLACITYLSDKALQGRNIVGGVYRRKIDQWDAFGFGEGDPGPMFRLLDESWINLSHGW